MFYNLDRQVIKANCELLLSSDAIDFSVRIAVLESMVFNLMQSKEDMSVDKFNDEVEELSATVDALKDFCSDNTLSFYSYQYSLVQKNIENLVK